ncbi:MAG: hypothetical protein OXC28_05010 [Defluviicoccus sp.]|nr:hypothetical protein [Defluviicoccus sp.]
MHYWIGQSGRRYAYVVHTIDHIPDNRLGNYIFAKMVGNAWVPVYIGEGERRERRQDAIDEGCVLAKNATHFHEHLNNIRSARKTEERDLIAGNPACKWPSGCNGVEF